MTHNLIMKHSNQLLSKMHSLKMFKSLDKFTAIDGLV